MEREDIIVLLRGIFYWCYEHWMLYDPSADEEEDIGTILGNLSKFDEPDEFCGIYEFLQDNRDCMDEIEHSVNRAVDALSMYITPSHPLFNKYFRN